MVSHFIPVISRKELFKEKAELFQNMVSVAVLIQKGFLFKNETKDTASSGSKHQKKIQLFDYINCQTVQ